MPVEPVGDLPPEAEQLRLALEKQLPDILTHFSQILHQQFGFEGVRVGGFTVVPIDSNPERLSCNEEHCSIN